MTSEPLLSFAVPDELLREAIRATRSEEVVADRTLMPGVGEGKPPPMRQILRRFGVPPILWLTVAAFVVGSVDAALGVFGPDIKSTFHTSDVGLAAAVFAASAAQIAVGVPIALVSDRGSRVAVSAWTLAAFGVLAPLLAFAPNIWVFAFVGIAASIGKAPLSTTHLSYLADAYPPEARARVSAYQRGADPLARTIGIAICGGVAAVTGDWRWGIAIGVVAIPVALFVARLPEPERGHYERSHILHAAGEDDVDVTLAPPRVLLGAAVQRLLRIRSLYFQLMAVAVLGFVGLGIPLFGSLYLQDHWDLGTGERTTVYTIVGLSAFLSIPVAGFVGDRLFRRRPESVLYLGGGCLVAFGVVYVSSLFAPALWLVVVGWFVAECCIAPLGTAIYQTVCATAPPEMRTLALALFGVFGLVIGGFLGAMILGTVSDAARAAGHDGPQAALVLMLPACVLGGGLLVLGGRHVRRDISLVIEDTLEAHREAERRSSGASVPALQVQRLDFAYDSRQVLHDLHVEVAEGEIVALLGTNGAGKSTLLRVVAGLDHPLRGTVRIFGADTTWLEAEQVAALDVHLLLGGRMTFPTLTVRENLRVATTPLRGRGTGMARAIDEALESFPELVGLLDRPAGACSGGEQQMLALARTLLTRPRLLLLDELTLGLAPRSVEGLLDVVRRVHASGTTIVLVEQSVNVAARLASRCYFMERGAIRFEGSVADLLARDDLLRPVFLPGPP